MPNLITLLIAAFTFLVSAIGAAQAHSLEYVEKQRLENGNQYRFFDRKFPDFTYFNLDGAKAPLAQFRGRIIILQNVDANCLIACSAPIDRLAKIQSMVNISPMRDLVQFVIVLTGGTGQLKPATATYISDNRIDPGNWTFVTPGAGQSAKFEKLWPVGTNNADLDKPVTHIIDANGHWRSNVVGSNFSSLKFVVYLNALYNDGAGIKDGHGK